MGKWSKKSEKLFLDIKKYGPQINRKIYYNHVVKLKEARRENSPTKINSIRKKIKKITKKSNNEFERRGYFIRNYSYAVPNKTAIEKIKKFSKGKKILEVGAGLGLWAFLLQDLGANIIATDDFSWKNKFQNKKYFTKIEKLNVQNSLDKYNDSEVLLLVWPPYDKPMANDSLKKFKGNKIVYIGEDSDGATGDYKFHNSLKKNWKQVDEYNIPGWIYIHDTMKFYERN